MCVFIQVSSSASQPNFPFTPVEPYWNQWSCTAVSENTIWPSVIIQAKLLLGQHSVTLKSIKLLWLTPAWLSRIWPRDCNGSSEWVMICPALRLLLRLVFFNTDPHSCSILPLPQPQPFLLSLTVESVSLCLRRLIFCFRRGGLSWSRAVMN